MQKEQALSGTAVLRPQTSAAAVSETDYVLEFHDPLRTSDKTAVSPHSVAGDPSQPLARDTTAPIAFRLSQQEGDAWDNFITPGDAASQSRLYMIEPFQHGKIPVVFVHGLLSDPLTWASLANDLRAEPGIASAYQLWAFEYPTGQPFLKSAAALRQELGALRQTYDPHQQDVALTKIVLVGHSMGGLVAKLMVAESGDALWRAAARSPLEAIRTTPETRTQLERSFFFSPSPGISRVVFVGTPHRGSTWSRRLVGRLGSSFVAEPPQRRAMHAQLMRDNPGVFSAELQRRIPTSIDLLDPESQLLGAVLRLPIAGDVRVHSIIGTGRSMPLEGPADGVVAVSSATHPGAESELMVDATHSELHRHAATTREIVRILELHAGELSRAAE
jgi:pimeloyl-ACP methyl ester carboxylesterase